MPKQADAALDDLRVAIVHDYLTQRGGAERVVVAMLDVFPQARVITSVYNPDLTFPQFRSRAIETTWLDRMKVFKADPRKAMPILPKAFADYPLRDVDIVLCSSSGFAHGVGGQAPKVVYCHNPPRWLYQPEDYLASSAARQVLRAVSPRLRAWDQNAARSAQTYLVNSTAVRDRVRLTYNRSAQVLPPPVTIDTGAARCALAGIRPGYLLTVGRARGYKNTAELARAMADLPDERLVVVGGLTPGDWPRNVIDAGRVSDSELRWLYANAEALIAISREDFGLTPIEAYSFGTPALVLRAGGFLDTTSPGLTGGFIEDETASAVVAAVRRHRQSRPLDRSAITEHAQRWSQGRFAADLRSVVERTLDAAPAAARPLRPLVPRALRVVHAERRGHDQSRADAERRGALHAG